MKKIWLVLFLLAFTSAHAADSISCKNLFNASPTIPASGTLTADVSKGSEGFFSIQPVFTGTGVLQIQYQTSNNGTDWSPAVSIIASATSKTVYPYPEAGVNIFAGYQRIVLTETGAANAVVLEGLYRCEQ